MRRFHLIEIEDQTWCPAVLRDAATDYLQHVTNVSNPYGATTERLRTALERTGTSQVIDLCSGGSGPWLRLQQTFAAQGLPLTVCLTDRYPNVGAFQHTQHISEDKIRFYAEPVDATQVPATLQGFRTLFASFHHFPPEQARAILNDAFRQRQGIGVFEATSRRLPTLLAMFLTPLMVLVLTPAIRPFRWSRLLWTYLIPLVPLIVWFDGLVSCLRTYSPAELQAMTQSLSSPDYTWEIGEEKSKGAPLPVTYLIGYPTKNTPTEPSA